MPALNYDMLPEHSRADLRNYFEHCILPDSFLLAVLENNLVDAFRYANAEDERAMKLYAIFLESAPREAWGSPERVAAWTCRMALRQRKLEEIQSASAR